jgi:hypothetical protein
MSWAATRGPSSVLQQRCRQHWAARIQVQVAAAGKGVLAVFLVVVHKQQERLNKQHACQCNSMDGMASCAPPIWPGSISINEHSAQTLSKVPPVPVYFQSIP